MCPVFHIAALLVGAALLVIHVRGLVVDQWLA
jgi:hypothetical protein